MLIISRMFLCLIFLLVSACTSSSEKQEPISVKESGISVVKQVKIPQREQPMIKTNQSWQQITVKYLAFEGGFYGLVSEKGAKLLPMNLSKEYQVEGTILKIKGKPLNDVMTIQQWGQPFEITDVVLIAMGKGNSSTH